MTAKEEILAKVRAPLGDSRGARLTEYAAIPRHYAQVGQLSPSQRNELFTDRLLDYGCGVFRCQSHEVSTAIHDILIERRKHAMLTTDDIPDSWLPWGFAFVQDRSIGYDEIKRCQGVLSRCAVAIAATGTIVLRHSPAEGRRAVSLIPDYHLCCVFEKQLVELVPEAIEEMSLFAGVPITTISGPSATADIEMTRVQGVHGPRHLDVLLIAPDPHEPHVYR